MYIYTRYIKRQIKINSCIETWGFKNQNLRVSIIEKIDSEKCKLYLYLEIIGWNEFEG